MMKRLSKPNLSEKSKVFLTPIAALFIAVIFTAVVIVISGNNPAKVFGLILRTTFGSVYGLTSVLRWMTPLLFLGIAASFSLSAGLWNLGMAGQMYLGAIFGAWIGYALPNWSGFEIKILAILFAAGAGTFWALIPALLKAFFGTNEFIVTLLMNFVAEFLTDFLVLNVWKDPAAGGETLSTPEIVDPARFSELVSGFSWNTTFFIALLVLLIYWVIMKRSTFGYEMKVHAKNPVFLKYGGVSVKKTIILSMCCSGAVAGIAGATEILGVYGAFYTRMFASGVAWDGLVVSLLGLLNPIGVFLSSFVFGFLKFALLTIERSTDISRAVVTIIQAILIIFIAIQGLAVGKRITQKRED